MQDHTDLTPSDIKAARTALGLSQAKFAAALGVTSVAVEHWEGGKRTPPAMLRLAIAALLNGLEPWEN